MINSVSSIITKQNFFKAVTITAAALLITSVAAPHIASFGTLVNYSAKSKYLKATLVTTICAATAAMTFFTGQNQKSFAKSPKKITHHIQKPKIKTPPPVKPKIKTPPPTGVEAHAGGWTSDHSPVQYSVNVLKADSTPLIKDLRVVTWNALNKCYSKENCKAKPPITPFSNNPWNQDETMNEYKTRIRKQNDFIINLIQNAKKNPLSAICLQEVNHLISMNSTANEKKAFCDKLESLGWILVTSKECQNTKNQAILVNTNRFKVINKRGILSNGTKSTGFEVTLQERATNKTIAVASCHLDLPHDYSQGFKNYQEEMINKNIPAIVAGDTNRAHGEKNQYNLAGNESFPTHIAKGHKLACYDRLAASPTKTTKVQIIEEGGKYFAQEKNGIKIKDFKPKNRVHTSEIGKYWEDKRSIIHK